MHDLDVCLQCTNENRMWIHLNELKPFFYSMKIPLQIHSFRLETFVLSLWNIKAVAIADKNFEIDGWK